MSMQLAGGRVVDIRRQGYMIDVPPSILEVPSSSYTVNGPDLDIITMIGRAASVPPLRSRKWFRGMIDAIPGVCYK